MAQEELEIEIDATGKVTMRTKGVKGPVCMEYADLLARIVGREESREQTHEFFESQEHVLFHVEHHLLHDGWSFNVFLGELVALYRAFDEGRRPSLPELAWQFADFACWQRAWLQGPVLQRQIRYWREHLANLAPLHLPTDLRGAKPRKVKL